MKFPSLSDISIFVSGHPRSGTSLMMQMMRKAGFEVLADEVTLKGNSEFDPHGSHELGDVAYYLETNDIESTSGKVLKLVSPFMHYLPLDREVRVIFMLRDPTEIISSLLAMRSLWKNTPIETNAAANRFLREHNIPVLYVQFKDVTKYPKTTAMRIGDFLGVELDGAKMAEAVDEKPRDRIKDVVFTKGMRPPLIALENLKLEREAASKLFTDEDKVGNLNYNAKLDKDYQEEVEANVERIQDITGKVGGIDPIAGSGVRKKAKGV